MNDGLGDFIQQMLRIIVDALKFICLLTIAFVVATLAGILVAVRMGLPYLLRLACACAALGALVWLGYVAFGLYAQAGLLTAGFSTALLVGLPVVAGLYGKKTRVSFWSANLVSAFVAVGLALLLDILPVRILMALPYLPLVLFSPLVLKKERNG